MSLRSLKGKVIGYDCETTGLNPWNSLVYQKHGMRPARPFAFAFKDLFGNSAYVRWEVDPRSRMVIPVKRDIKDMSEILGDPSITKVGHNLAFDIRMTRLSGVKFDWTRIHDTAILAHILKGGVSGEFSFKLKVLGKAWLDIPDDDEKALMESVKEARHEAKDKGWKISTKETHGDQYIKSDYWLGDKELVKEYALTDVDRALGLYELLMEAGKEQDPDALALYLGTELPLLRTVYRMEQKGIKCFPEKTESLYKFYMDYANKWRAKADEQGGEGINFNSPKQLVKIFCEDKGYETKNTTPAGKPSVDADELSRLAQTEPLAKSILECKAAESMVSKFLNSYERLRTWNEVSIVHPSFHQTGTRTGRFSSSNPNFQQLASPDSIKKRADIPLRPREAFGPREGNYWLMADYSQMEVWVFAFAANDPILTKALMAGEDVHDSVGKRIWGTLPDFDKNRKAYRKKGKTMMFLKQYGGGPSAAKNLLNCNENEARKTIDEFDRALPGVNKFIKELTTKTERDRIVENVFGRASTVERGMAYTGINYLIQGSCADIMKRAMVRIDRLLRAKYKGDAYIVLTIHDELVIEASKRLSKKQLCRDIIEAMQKDSKLVGIPVPLPVSMKLTETTWAEAREITI